MKRTSGDYVAIQSVKCEICGRQVFQGMYIYMVELRGGRKGVAHSLCETKKNGESSCQRKN